MGRVPEEIRERIIARDRGCCGRFLGGACSPVIDIHHIIPRDEGGTDEDGNLLAVCHRHHPMLEALRRGVFRYRDQGWRRCKRHRHPYKSGRDECERRLNGLPPRVAA